MPGTYCAVRVCKNSADAKRDITFHICPTDQKFKEIWKQSCNRYEPSWNPKVFHVCSDHFSADSYERDLRSELLNLPPKKKLKTTAVPTVNLVEVQTQLPFSLDVYENDIAQTENLPQDLQHSTQPEDLPEDLQHSNVQIRISLEDHKIILKQKDEEIAKLKEEFAKLQQSSQKTIESLQNENKSIQKLLNEANESVKTLTREKIYQDEQNKKGRNHKEISKAEKQRILEETFKGVLTKNQIEILLGKKNYAHWTDEELSMAFTLRYMGKKAYLYVKHKLRIPLPSLSKLHRWAAKLNIQPGSLQCVLECMKAVAPSFQPSERVAVISFDEVKTDELYEYDQKNDKVMGPHSQMQVAMVRGLFGKWKVPVYLDFDQKMTPDILLDLIKKIHEAGYLVKAAVSDMGGGNQGLLKELGVSHEQTWIPHPVEKNEKIYFFADAPHCLKLMRNWLLDYGFTLSDGSTVNKKPLEALVAETASPDNPSEISSCHKLTEAHLKCQKTQRQSVRLANELISNTVANALIKYLPGDDPEAAMRLSAVISTMNGWFDIHNSYTLYSTPYKSAYGTHLELQDKCLDDMYTLMKTMRCTGKASLQVFQKAVMLSIQSLKDLRLEMEINYQKPYILTHRLNQDLLENFFSQIRTRGGLHDHPTPLQCMYRVRMIILGKNPGIVQANSNALDQSKTDGDSFLTATAMSRVEECSSVSSLEPPEAQDSFLTVTALNVLEDTEDPEGEGEETDDASELPDNMEEETCEINLSEEEKNQKSEMQETMERDGLEYLAGWVAYKHKKVSWLGQPTREGANKSYAHLPSWVQQLSFGGLMQPSSEWLSAAEKMEDIFNKFHGEKNICKGPNTVQRCVNKILVEITSVAKEVVQTFVLQRTRIRIKFLNAYLYVEREKEKVAKAQEKAEKQRQYELEKEKQAAEKAEQMQKKVAEKERKEAERKEQQRKKAEEKERKKSGREEQTKKKTEEKNTRKAEREEQQRRKAEEKQNKAAEKARELKRKADERENKKAEQEQSKRKKLAEIQVSNPRKRSCALQRDIDPKQRKISRKMKKLIR